MRIPLALIAAVCMMAQDTSVPAPRLWGTPVDGMKLAVELLPGDAGGRLRVTVRNSGDRQQLLPAAVVNNTKFGNWPIALVVSTSGGERRFGRFPFAGSTMGHVDPVSIPMLPESSYTFEIPVTGWHKQPGQLEELRGLIGQPGCLWVEWEVAPVKNTQFPNCPIWGPLATAEVTCWEHKMLSNTLLLPRGIQGCGH